MLIYIEKILLTLVLGQFNFYLSLYIPNRYSVLLVSKPRTRPKAKALFFGFIANAHGFNADPLSDIARLNKPAASGDSTKK